MKLLTFCCVPLGLLRKSILVASLAAIVATATVSNAAVVIFDGFGDGDINNNGTPFEDNTFVQNAAMDDVLVGSGDTIDTYEPFLDGSGNRRDTPLIYPLGTMITEPTTADDATDTGILWTATGGITNNGLNGDPAARPRIISDAPGDQPETGIGFFNSIANQTQVIPALNSGLALGIESKGRTRSVTGFFERDQSYSAATGGNGKQDTVAVGPNVDDTLTVSFDFRVWMSAPNYNEGDTNNHTPNRGELRFGIHQDADDELGGSHIGAGPVIDGVPNPRIWGQEPGWFRGDRNPDQPDASGDPGWFVRLPLKDPAAAVDNLFGPFADGRAARINEETNPNAGDIILQGSGTGSGGDVQTVAQPQEDPPLSDNFNFQNIETQKRYRIEFSLRRFDETGGSTNPNDPGDNIEATVTVTNLDDANETFSLSGFDALDPMMMDPDAGFSSDAFDYFTISTGGSSNSDEFDYVIDNFMVEIFGSNAPADDADVNDDGIVDGTDFLILQRTDAGQIPLWESTYGTSGVTSSVAAVPEPTTLVGFCLGGLLLVGKRRRFA